MLVFVLGVFLLLSTRVSASLDLTVLYEWKYLEFDFDSVNISNYNYNATSFPTGVEINPQERGELKSRKVYMSIARFLHDSPYSLVTVSSEYGEGGPILHPYPSADWHNGDCFTITSAFRMQVDECNHMWVLDSGFVEGKQMCPPKVYIFDLGNDELVKYFPIDKELYKSGSSILSNILLYTMDPAPHGNCEKTMVYVADPLEHGLIVYNTDVSDNRGWRIENEFMYPQIEWGNHSINGKHFIQLGGMYAFSLNPATGDENDRYMYFHAFAGNKEVRVPLRVLNNESIWLKDNNAMKDSFEKVGTRDRQSMMELMDENGNLFSSLEDPLAISVWNINDGPFNSDAVVANNVDQLQYVSSMKNIKLPEDGILVMSNSYQKIMTNTLNLQDTNFRIMYQSIKDLLDRVNKN